MSLCKRIIWQMTTFPIMGVKIALCQAESSVGEVGKNLDRIMNVIIQNRADVYVFPELFLTGYGADYSKLKDDVGYAMDKMALWCMENDIAIVIGSPHYENNSVFNSLFFITQNKRVRYDKMYLAKFGVYTEHEFREGVKPAVAEFKGMKFGLSVCYDIFFPEIFRFYAVKGVDANICVAASADPSREYLERILPARSLENVVYTVYVNNVGKYGENRMYGHSRLVGPLGNTLGETGEKDEILCLYMDRSVIENARNIRRHMSDLRNDISWRV